MSRETLLQSSFNAGAISPRLAGRTDFKKYGSSVAEMSNCIPLASGPTIFRPGTIFRNTSRDSAISKKSRLIPYKFNTQQAYVLEFSEGKIRFYKNGGIVLSGGVPYEVTTPYLEADLPNITFTQDSSVLYLALSSSTVPPKCLVRLSDTNWQLRDMVFKDGPYLDPQKTTNAAALTAVTFTSSATTGSVTVTASAAAFAATDVGRIIRMGSPSGTITWGWGVITAFTSTTVVTVSITSPTVFPAGATTNWRLGAFSQTTGYPSVVVLHEGRLVYANTVSFPNYIWLSESQGYGQEVALFAPSATTGTVTDANSIYLPLSAGDVSSIVWMSSGDILAIGTADGEWSLVSGDSTKALSPTNSRATRRSTRGSRAGVQAVRVDATVMYTQATGSKVNRFTFDFNQNTYLSTDLTLLSEHYFQGNKVAEMVYAPEPYSQVWARMDDGTLRSLTFVDSEDVGGWAKHNIAGTNAFVESLAVIPASDASYSELWMIVRRVINGSTVRYIETLSKPFFLGNKSTDATYVDCSLRYSGAPTTTLTGLSHLEGQTVSVMYDGANHPPVTVSGGSVTLVSTATNAVVGLPYNGDIVTLDFDAQNAFGGSSMGQIRKITEVALRLFETGDLYTARGDQADSALNLLEPRKFNDLMDTATDLITGLVEVSVESSWALSSTLHIQFRSPLPATVCTLQFKAMVNEG